MRWLIITVMPFLIFACTSKPYVMKTTVNETTRKRTEIVCTNKTAVIPWYIGVAAGFFTYRYGEKCTEIITSLDQQSIAEKILLDKQKEQKESDNSLEKINESTR